MDLRDSDTHYKPNRFIMLNLTSGLFRNLGQKTALNTKLKENEELKECCKMGTSCVYHGMVYVFIALYSCI